MRDVKRVLFVFLVLAGHTGKFYAQDQFPIGVYFTPYDRTNDHFVRFDQVDSLGFNFVTLSSGVTGSINPNFYRPVILEGMDSAAIHGMGVVVADRKIDIEPRSQRSIYQAESYEFDLTSIDNHFTQKGSQYLEVIDPQDGTKAVEAIAGTHTAGRMVWRPQPREQVETGDYYLKPRLRVEGGEIGQPVVTVRAILQSTPPDTLCVETILVDQYNTVGYYEYSFSFPRTTGVTPSVLEQSMPMGVEEETPLIDRITYEVYWHGYVTTFLDYVKVDDEVANNLFAGQYDTGITSTAEIYRDHSSGNLFRLYTDDEPGLRYMYSSGYIENLLENVAGADYPTGGGITAVNRHEEDFYGRLGYDLFLTRAHESQLAVDYYPFTVYFGSPYQDPQVGGYDEGPGIEMYDSLTYNNDLQLTLSTLRTYLRNARFSANNSGVPFYYIPQLHGCYGCIPGYNHEYTIRRNPTPWEINVEVYMALVYSADGLFYFLYENPEADGCCPGLVQTQTHRHDINYDEYLDPGYGPIFTGYQLKWEAVREINDRLNILSSTLVHLDWQTGYPISMPENNSIISSINGASDIEVGEFIHQITGEEYFILVNRQCRPNDIQILSVELEQSSEVRHIVDVIAAKGGWDGDSLRVPFRTLAENENSFQLKLYPGEGRLLFIDSFAPTVPTGFSIINYNNHPKLSWNENTEANLAGYNVFRRLPGQFWALKSFVEAPTTMYIDYEIAWGNQFDPDVCYMITSVDVFDNESLFSSRKCIPFRGIQKVIIPKLPNDFALSENFPNPFNTMTTIKYDLPEESFVELMIFDILGREVKTVMNGIESIGFKSIVWDGKDDDGNNVPSGMYIYHFNAKSFESDKQFHKIMKMVLLR